MHKNFHLRASLDQLIAAIEEQLAREGFARLDERAPVDPSARRLAVYARDGWVGVADEVESDTRWGEVLSRALELPVVELSGECDHAFFSQVALYRGGALRNKARVPEDAVLEDDGRYRIRPTFLREIYPSASKALSAGVVVDRLGGEKNSMAVGRLLGLARPTLCPHDTHEGDRMLWFRDLEAHRREQGASRELVTMIDAVRRAIGGDLSVLQSIAASGESKRRRLGSVLEEAAPARVPEPSRPILVPPWAPAEHREHYEQTYRERSHAALWVAFDRPWSKIGPLIEELATPLVALVAAAGGGKQPLSVEVVRRGGERLEFRGPVAMASADDKWRRIRAELERGADVRFVADEFEGDGFVDIMHQPAGANLLPEDLALPDDGRRFPPVVLALSLPRPDRPEMVARLAELARFVLRAAGEESGHLGGFVTAEGLGFNMPATNTAYECLAGTRMATTDSAWLASHARTPGWCVLLPDQAAARIAPAADDGIALARLRHGVLVQSAARDPFAYSDADAERMERRLLPAIGTAEEEQRVRAYGTD